MQLERQYIVLRRPESAAASRGATSLSRGGSILEPEVEFERLKIEEETLDDVRRADLERDPRTEAVVESMPLQLIEPVVRSEGLSPYPVEPGTASDADDAAAWGVEAVGALASRFDGRGVLVAVLDTGIDAEHPAFAGITLERKNFTRDSDDGDVDGHGTHVAGTIFGREVAGRRVGVAPGIDRALIGKVLGRGGGSSLIIIRAIQWAVERQAQVVCMSLGIDFPGYVESLVERSGMPVNVATSMGLEAYRANINLFNSLANLVAMHAPFGGVTVILAASGNESRRPEFEVAAAPPAAATGVTAVGAVGRGAAGFEVAAFSNTGVDLCAPGVDVLSAVPGGGLGTMSGTSMATPHVAGVAALWVQKLRETDRVVKQDVLKAMLLANGSREGFAEGHVGSADVGVGMVHAPLR